MKGDIVERSRILSRDQVTRTTRDATPHSKLPQHTNLRAFTLDRFCLTTPRIDGMAAVAEWYRHRIVAGFVTSSNPVPLKTRRVGQRCTLNLSRAETSSRRCGVVVRRGVTAQVSSTSLDHGSKLRGPSPKALV
ncbi:uncharacterized protein TNCV_2809921 [Trichonephila clavipes]|nr:uncharacterized protein TNCV_2809921 [Trichonephila clavipes]